MYLPRRKRLVWGAQALQDCIGIRFDSTLSVPLRDSPYFARVYGEGAVLTCLSWRNINVLRSDSTLRLDDAEISYFCTRSTHFPTGRRLRLLRSS